MRVRDGAGRFWAAVVASDPADADQLRRRAEQVARVHHPHLAAVGRVVELADGSIALLEEEIGGSDLTAVCSGRGGWAPGEVVTIVVPLAEALGELHDVGLAHGDVSPGNVVLRPDGQPVLVNVVSAARSSYARASGMAAPERSRGATPACDVFALGRLGAHLLSAGEAVGGEGLAPLLSSLARACEIDPACRPGSRELANEVYAACEPVAVGVPDLAVLARLSLHTLAEPDVGPTTVRASGRRGRHRDRRRWIRPSLVAGLVAGLLLAAVVGIGVRGSGDPATQDVELIVACPTEDPVAAAVRLTVARARAINEGDRIALARVTVPGSPAARADLVAAVRASAAQESAARTPLVQGGPRTPDGASIGVLLVQVLDVGRVAPPAFGGLPAGGLPQLSCPASVRVDLVSRIGLATPGTVAEVPAQAVVLVMRPTASGWRVSDVEPDQL